MKAGDVTMDEMLGLSFGTVDEVKTANLMVGETTRVDDVTKDAIKGDGATTTSATTRATITTTTATTTTTMTTATTTRMTTTTTTTLADFQADTTPNNLQDETVALGDIMGKSTTACPRQGPGPRLWQPPERQAGHRARTPGTAPPRVTPREIAQCGAAAAAAAAAAAPAAVTPTTPAIAAAPAAAAAITTTALTSPQHADATMRWPLPRARP